MAVVLSKTWTAPRRFRIVPPLVAFPDVGPAFRRVAGIVDESGKLPARDGMTTDGVGLLDRDLVLGVLAALQIMFALRFSRGRAHHAGVGRHDHHLGPMLVIFEPLGLAGTRLEPAVRRAVDGPGIDLDATLGAVARILRRRRR